MSMKTKHCLTVYFQCASSTCNKQDGIEVKQCDKMKRQEACSCCNTAIYVASCVKMCTNCNGRYNDGMGENIRKSLYDEAVRISKAYYIAFADSGCWGLTPKFNRYDDVQVRGKIIWIRRVQDNLTEPNFVGLDSGASIAEPDFQYAGQNDVFLDLAISFGYLKKAVERIKKYQEGIFKSTWGCRHDLLQRGFMVEGQYVRVDYLNQRLLERKSKMTYDAVWKPTWRFMEHKNRTVKDLIIVTWKMKDGEHVCIEEPRANVQPMSSSGIQPNTSCRKRQKTVSNASGSGKES